MPTRGFWQLGDVDDLMLVARLKGLLSSGARIEARVVAHLAEVDARRLYAVAGSPSLFDYCVTLGFSENQAFCRIAAARAARRFPLIFELLEQRRVHVTTIALVRKHLTDDNHAELLREACGKTKEQVLRLLAARWPKPDVADDIRRLPAQTCSIAFGPTATLEPRSAETYRLQLNASEALRNKLEHACDLMSHVNPSRDLALVLERGLDLLIERLQARKFGQKRARSSTVIGKQEAGRAGRETGAADSPAPQPNPLTAALRVDDSHADGLRVERPRSHQLSDIPGPDTELSNARGVRTEISGLLGAGQQLGGLTAPETEISDVQGVGLNDVEIRGTCDVRGADTELCDGRGAASEVCLGQVTELCDGRGAGTELCDVRGADTELCDGRGAGMELCDGRGAGMELCLGQVTELCDGLGANPELCDGLGVDTELCGVRGAGMELCLGQVTELCDGLGANPELCDGLGAGTELCDGLGANPELSQSLDAVTELSHSLGAGTELCHSLDAVTELSHSLGASTELCDSQASELSAPRAAAPGYAGTEAKGPNRDMDFDEDTGPTRGGSLAVQDISWERRGGGRGRVGLEHVASLPPFSRASLDEKAHEARGCGHLAQARYESELAESQLGADEHGAGDGSKPKRASRTRKHIANDVRRAVIARDGMRCTYLGVDGMRCTATTLLQLHHEAAWCLGGPDSVENLRLLCATHNRLLAAQEFGEWQAAMREEVLGQAEMPAESA